MTDIAALRAQIKQNSTDVLTREIHNLAVEMGSILGGSRVYRHEIEFRVREGKITLYFEKEGGAPPRFMVISSQVGTTGFPLTEAAGFVRIEACKHLPELCKAIIADCAAETKEVSQAIAAVRGLRDELNHTDEKFVAEAAEEAQAQYIHNLKVRYEDLLAVLRTENDGLHTEVKSTREKYETLYELVEDVFLGCDDDARSINLVAVEALLNYMHTNSREGETK